MENVDICIRGNGIVGSTLALLLSRLNLRVALIGNFQAAKLPDIRAYAINAKSKSILESIHAWPTEPSCTEVQQIRVSSDEGELIEFAHELMGSNAAAPLSWIVEVDALEAELAKALKLSSVQCVPYSASLESSSESSSKRSPSRANSSLSHLSTVPAPLTVICEGSSTRVLGKENLNTYINTHTKRTPYYQFALATHVTFKNPDQKHWGIAHQWFNSFNNAPAASVPPESQKEFEILALLPIGGSSGNTFAVVWSTSEKRNHELALLSDAELTQALAQSSKNVFPDLVAVSARQSWPLALSSAAAWCGRSSAKESWVLCGDSAHSVHPLSGMGLNLGLGDAYALYELLHTREKEHLTWRPLSELRLLRSYERQRKLAILPYVQFIDKIQLLFASGYPIAKLIRNQGFKAFNALGGLKEWTIKKAMQANF